MPLRYTVVCYTARADALTQHEAAVRKQADMMTKKSLFPSLVERGQSEK